MSGAPIDHWMQFYNHNASGASQTQTQTGPSLSPDSGRVAKPARKRSRASRRTPTTLLNTDKSNFRAMVQQFTGGPAFANNPNLMAFAGGYQLQQYQTQTQPQPQPQPQLQYQGYSNMVYSGQGQDPINTGGLIQRLMMEGQGQGQGQGDGASSATARPGSGGSNENTSSSYLF